MNILIIDDQIPVVKGLVNGISWTDIAIKDVFEAYNASDAKEIIKHNRIQIILCDIEMPGESGLSLFHWIKDNNYDIECMFLTAHADFAFAQEAIALGGADYILQPARYEVVEKAIVKAEQKIKDRNEIKEFSEFGKALYQNKDLVLEGYLKKWLLDKDFEAEKTLTGLNKIGYNIGENTPIYISLIQVISWKEVELELDRELLAFVLQNILSELLVDYGGNVLIYWLDTGEFAVVIYNENARELHLNTIKEVLEYFIKRCDELLGCLIACYIGSSIAPCEVHQRIIALLELEKENIALKSIVSNLDESGRSFASHSFLEKMQGWPKALLNGNAQQVKNEAYLCLDEGKLNAQLLKCFYRDFMEIISTATKQLGITNYQMFDNKELFNKSLTAYQSIKSMRELIDYSVSFFEKETLKNDIDYVETIVQYIHYNIELDIRRNELAQLVNLNEDYLSRLFKKEKGISLKEFIIEEKMKVAKELLQTTNFSIGTIAMKVGYDNFSHFSKTYKRIMGINPAEERNV